MPQSLPYINANTCYRFVPTFQASALRDAVDHTKPYTAPHDWQTQLEALLPQYSAKQLLKYELSKTSYEGYDGMVESLKLFYALLSDRVWIDGIPITDSIKQDLIATLCQGSEYYDSMCAEGYHGRLETFKGTLFLPKTLDALLQKMRQGLVLTKAATVVHVNKGGIHFINHLTRRASVNKFGVAPNNEIVDKYETEDRSAAGCSVYFADRAVQEAFTAGFSPIAIITHLQSTLRNVLSESLGYRGHLDKGSYDKGDYDKFIAYLRTLLGNETLNEQNTLIFNEAGDIIDLNWPKLKQDLWQAITKQQYFTFDQSMQAAFDALFAMEAGSAITEESLSQVDVLSPLLTKSKDAQEFITLFSRPELKMVLAFQALSENTAKRMFFDFIQANGHDMVIINLAIAYVQKKHPNIVASVKRSLTTSWVSVNENTLAEACLALTQTERYEFVVRHSLLKNLDSRFNWILIQTLSDEHIDMLIKDNTYLVRLDDNTVSLLKRCKVSTLLDIFSSDYRLDTLLKSKHASELLCLILKGDNEEQDAFIKKLIKCGDRNFLIDLAANAENSTLLTCLLPYALNDVSSAEKLLSSALEIIEENESTDSDKTDEQDAIIKKIGGIDKFSRFLFENPGLSATLSPLFESDIKGRILAAQAFLIEQPAHLKQFLQSLRSQSWRTQREFLIDKNIKKGLLKFMKDDKFLVNFFKDPAFVSCLENLFMLLQTWPPADRQAFVEKHLVFDDAYLAEILRDKNNSAPLVRLLRWLPLAQQQRYVTVLSKYSIQAALLMAKQFPADELQATLTTLVTSEACNGRDAFQTWVDFVLQQELPTAFILPLITARIFEDSSLCAECVKKILPILTIEEGREWLKKLPSPAYYRPRLIDALTMMDDVWLNAHLSYYSSEAALAPWVMLREKLALLEGTEGVEDLVRTLKTIYMENLQALRENDLKLPEAYKAAQHVRWMAVLKNPATEALLEAQNDNGVKKIWMNIIACIGLLFVGYVVACTLNYFSTGGKHFFFHPTTDRMRIAKDIQTTLEETFVDEVSVPNAGAF